MSALVGRNARRMAFAAHARHAEPEMRRLAQDVIARLPRTDSDDAIHTLLASRS
jgi:hypothetical protein